MATYKEKKPAWTESEDERVKDEIGEIGLAITELLDLEETIMVKEHDLSECYRNQDRLRAVIGLELYEELGKRAKTRLAFEDKK
jgi:hypothetical protein